MTFLRQLGLMLALVAATLVVAARAVPERRLLMMLKLPADHLRPQTGYSGDYSTDGNDPWRAGPRYPHDPASVMNQKFAIV